MSLREYFSNKKLLSNGKDNTKTAKNKIRTYSLSLLPHKLNSSGENLCKFSTKECRKVCLNMSGRAGFNSVQQARLKKTDYFVEHREEFLIKLYYELLYIESRGEKCAVRLNMTSDIDWYKQFKSIDKDIGIFKNITFYDYTKDPFKIEANKVKNQHFTFSYSGGNWKWCERFLAEKVANISVVFKNSIPLEWNGYKVINGDMSDERILDEKGVIVGLKYKIPRKVKYEKSKFVVEN